MQSLSTLQTATRLVTNHANRLNVQARASGPGLPSVVGGRAIEPERQQLSSFDSIYSVNHVDATKQKINLMERLGKAFGFDIETFKDTGALAQAVERELSKLSPKAMMAAEQAVAKDLGLDELGFSLRDLLEAMKNPGGEKDRKLHAALSGNRNEETSSSTGRNGPIVLDDIGRYGPR